MDNGQQLSRSTAARSWGAHLEGLLLLERQGRDRRESELTCRVMVGNGRAGWVVMGCHSDTRWRIVRTDPSWRMGQMGPGAEARIRMRGAA